MDRDDRHHDRDALLQAVICGDLPEDAEAVQEALRADPALSGRLRRLRALAGRLDQLGEVDRASLQGSLGQSAPPAHDAIVADALARHRPRRRPILPLYAALAAAAAVVVLLLVQLLSNGGNGHDPDLNGLELGPGPGEMWPVGQVESYDTTYRWNFELPRQGRFEIVFYNAGDPERTVVLRADAGDSTKWQPNEDDLRLLDSLPRLVWEVRALNAEDDLDSTPRSAEIWRP